LETTVVHQTATLAALHESVEEMKQATRSHSIKATCYRGAQSAVQWAGVGGSALAAVYFFGRLLGWWSS
jgi:CII-binding regulator of phage lambda lysogenization HflD